MSKSQGYLCYGVLPVVSQGTAGEACVLYTSTFPWGCVWWFRLSFFWRYRVYTRHAGYIRLGFLFSLSRSVGLRFFSQHGHVGLLRSFSSLEPPTQIVKIDSEKLSLVTTRLRGLHAETAKMSWDGDGREMRSRSRKSRFYLFMSKTTGTSLSPLFKQCWLPQLCWSGSVSRRCCNLVGDVRVAGGKPWRRGLDRRLRSSKGLERNFVDFLFRSNFLLVLRLPKVFIIILVRSINLKIRRSIGLFWLKAPRWVLRQWRRRSRRRHCHDVQHCAATLKFWIIS